MKRRLLAPVMLICLTASAYAGDVQQPPLDVPCDPATQTCTASQSGQNPNSEPTPTDGTSELVAIVANLTASLLGLI